MNKVKLILKIGKIQKHAKKNKELDNDLENWLNKNVTKPYNLDDFEKLLKYYNSIKCKY